MGLARNQLAATVAATKAAPRGEMLEGVVISGSWDAAEGVVQVLVGDTVGYESQFFADGNQPFMPICTLVCPAIGDQYAPVGGERALIWESQGSWVCWLEHGPDDTSAVPAGERWIQHRSAASPNAVAYDSALHLKNDGPTTGDSLGGAVLGGTGALTQSQTKSGARSTIDDTAQKIESVTAGGLTSGQYDQVKQIVQSVVAGQLQTIIDGVAQKITHQASPTVQAIVDGAGKTISLVVPAGVGNGSIGLGDLFTNLPAASGAINNSILTTYSGNIQQTIGNVAQQMAQAAIAAGVTNASTWLAEIQAGLPSLSFINIASSVASLATPSGSGIVRLAS